ncbi:MAG: WD40/YVTN/BNR-like repeat-containing protein [Planctomycetota bacterium]|jgi:hypothetical protein
MAWSDSYHYDKYLFVHAADTVFAARVDQTEFTYPLYEVDFDSVTVGAFGDIAPGMTVLFGSTAGASDLGRQRIRKDATSSTLFVGWSSRGIRDGELNLADNAYITVLDDYRAWAKIPRISPSGILYKDFGVTWPNGTPSPPVANGGVGVMRFVDETTQTISVDFDGTDSFVTAPGASISTYAWDFVDGTPPSSASSTPSGVSFPTGFRWVSLTVTDDNAETHITYIPVAALSSVSEASYAGASYNASSYFLANPPADAFDGTTATRWGSAIGPQQGWIDITFPSPVTISAYRMISDSTNMTKMPRDWFFQVGAAHTTVDTRTGVSWAADETQHFDLASPVTDTVFRIFIDYNNGDPQISIPEIELMESNPNYFTKFEVNNQTLTRNGQTFGVTIHESVPSDTYYDGALIMYMEHEYYNDVLGSLAGPAGRENVKFIGWHDTDPASLAASDSTYITSTELTCVDIGGRMRQLPAFPQAVLRDASPSSWLEMVGSNTDRYVHYLLHWHSTVLNIAPFTWSGTGETYALPRFQSPGKNLFEQVNFRAASIAHVLTIDMRGQLGLTPDPQLQDSGDRTSVIITDIDPADWSAVNYTHQRPPRVYWHWGNSVVANTQEADASDLKIDAVFCVSPGKAPGQGGNEQTQGEQLVEDQDELNAREGHRYAVRANPFETFFDVAIVHPGDVGIDPARMEWVRLTITSALAAQRGLTLTDERFLPFEVDIVHNSITQTKEQFLRAEREREGTPAATVVPETGDVLPDTPDIDDWPWVWEDETGPGLFRGQRTIAAFDTGSNLYTTTDFDTPEVSGGPTWTTTDLTALSPALSGTPLSVVGDAFSPQYLGTGTTVNGWILTTTGIYSITDVFGVSGGPTLALQHTLATANPDNALINMGFGIEDWVIASCYYSTAGAGTIAIRTTDGGSTWTEATITPHYWTGAAIGGRQPPLHVSSKTAGLAYAGAYSASAPDDPPGALYKSLDYGATWALTTTPNTSFNGTNGGTLQFPWHDNANELMLYSTYSDVSVISVLYRTESDGSTLTDVSPISDAAPRKMWALSVCPIDRQHIATAASVGLSQGAVFVSNDAGDSWTQSTPTVAGASRFESVAIAGNDRDVIYIWGNNLQISYSQDFGATWEDKTTALIGSDEIIVIMGG